jgi:LPXTG-motif cell wall-anchored protein
LGSVILCNGVDGRVATLAPGESVTCTVSLVATQRRVDDPFRAAGSVSASPQLPACAAEQAADCLIAATASSDAAFFSTPQDGSGTLPKTGNSDLGLTLTLGAFAALAGLMLIITSRRRRLI